MKFSVSSRQTAEYLAKADEIRVEWRDRRIIPELCEKYPNTTIDLTRHYQDTVEHEIDWKELNTYRILSRDKLIIGFSLPTEMGEAKKEGHTFYFLAPVRTFQELNDYKRAGVCRVEVDAPLFFQMNKVKEFGIPLYAVANVANSSSIFERENGVAGTWIRPEDVKTYEPYIETLQFWGNQSQEQALYRIYAEKGEWSGELGMLIKDLNYICTNRMVPPTLAVSRLTCGQKCQENNRCHLCYRTFDLANPELLRNYLASTEEN